MPITVNTEYTEKFIDKKEYDEVFEETKNAFRRFINDHNNKLFPTAWFDLPNEYDRKEFNKIKKYSEIIRKKCEVFVVIGIGGSYLGARSAIEFIQGKFHNQLKKSRPLIFFAGTGIDGDELHDISALCENKDICINVVSKSGTTTEPAIAFRYFRRLLEEKYGKEEARNRIFVTTENVSKSGSFKELADKEGYETFSIPRDIGGRYSVLTSAGLLPIAVAGIDLDEIMSGALKAKNELTCVADENNIALKYVTLRNVFYRHGKKNELFVSYSPKLEAASEWLKQLFAESEGKNGKGIFPVSAVYTRDLHSLGQYVQDGERTMFETVFFLKDTKYHLVIPHSEIDSDGIRYLEGKEMGEINKSAFLGSAETHVSGDVPSIVLEIDREDEYNFGYFVYFFELSCAVSGYLIGVNPFDQPGVEGYKNNMFTLLGKPGYIKNN